MTIHEGPAKSGDFTGEGEWTPLLEDLLRGLVHAMNNRITAVSAFAEMPALEVDDGQDSEMLRHEIHRLHAVSSLVGVLASRTNDAEALELGAVLDLALTIHSHHPRMRSLPCTGETTGAVLPVRVPRWALLRLFLLLVDTAKRAGAAADVAAVTVRLSGDERFVRARVTAMEPLGADAVRLAECCGGSLRLDGREVVLELPSLIEVRRREAAGG